MVKELLLFYWFPAVSFLAKAIAMLFLNSLALAVNCFAALDNIKLSSPPLVSTERNAPVVILSLTFLFRASLIRVTRHRFGKNFLFVLRLECETLCPNCGFTPVNSHILAMT
jgi:hypothetical protein